jgi:hypothetical protein
MAYRTNNLFVGSLGHAVNNGLIVTALALTPTATTAAAQKQLVESGDMSTPDALIAIAIWLPALAVSLYWFAQNTRDMTARYAPYDEYEEYVAAEHAFDFISPNEEHDRNDDREETGT